ncbi:hypothetical protein LN650_11170 [Klebsiella pneumoniae subsp. pneumoniae]|nr:hypothetical protein [Klebsiella pneumoniae subsp. pneumoniae]
MVELIRQSQAQTHPLDNDAEHDVHFTEAQLCFSRAIHWLTQDSIRRQINVSSLLKEMENHARKRLQPRKWLGKACLSEEIASLLDEHSDNPYYLREAFSDMGTRNAGIFQRSLRPCKPCQNCGVKYKDNDNDVAYTRIHQGQRGMDRL